MGYYYNPYSLVSWNDQYRSYIKNYSTIRSFEDAIENQTQRHEEQLQQVSKEQREAVKESTELVCGTLENGFSQVATHLYEISDDLRNIDYSVNEVNLNVQRMTAILGSYLSMVFNEIRITNEILTNITELLQIPEFIKEKEYFLRRGIQMFINAQFDNDLYLDAEEFFLKALEKDSKDWFVLHRLGLLYLNSKNEKCNSVIKAEQKFREAFKYADAESDPKSYRLAKIIVGDVRRSYTENPASVEDMRIVSSQSYLHAAICCYIQGKERFEEAINLLRKANELAPTYSEVGFHLAKLLAANGQVEKSIPKIREIIRRDPQFSVMVAEDIDLGSKKEVQNLLLLIRDEKIKTVNEGLEKVLKINGDTQAQPIIEEIRSLISKNRCLEALIAEIEFHRKRDWLPFLETKNQSIRNSSRRDASKLFVEKYDQLLNNLTKKEAELENKLDLNEFVSWERTHSRIQVQLSLAEQEVEKCRE